MKAQDVDKFLARWQATLSPAFAPAYVDGYFRRHRAEIEALVDRALAERAARHGERPRMLWTSWPTTPSWQRSGLWTRGPIGRCSSY
jgi:hypothetical protein